MVQIPMVVADINLKGPHGYIHHMHVGAVPSNSRLIRLGLKLITAFYSSFLVHTPPGCVGPLQPK
jgi:hypothetical protein